MRIFRSADVLRVFEGDLNQRRLIDFCEKNVVGVLLDAKGTGSRRLFSYSNLVEIGLAATLENMGVMTHQTKASLMIFRQAREIQAKRWAIEEMEKYLKGIHGKTEDSVMIEDQLEDLKGGHRRVGDRFLESFELKDPLEWLVILFNHHRNPTLFIKRKNHPEDFFKMLKNRVCEHSSSIVVNFSKIQEKMQERVDPVGG
jgi:hypothetical protein